MMSYKEYRLHVAALVMAELVAKGDEDYVGRHYLRDVANDFSEVADTFALSLADHMGLVRVVGEQKR